MARTVRLTAVLALAGAASLAALALAEAKGAPAVGALPVFLLVSLSLVVGLSTAASP